MSFTDTNDGPSTTHGVPVTDFSLNYEKIEVSYGQHKEWIPVLSVGHGVNRP